VNLIITGNPGVGKHTVAEKLIMQDPEYQLIDINKFAIEKGFTEKVKDGLEVDTMKLKNTIKDLTLEKSLIIGHLAPYVINESKIDFAFVLRKNPYNLIEIYKNREYNESKIKENIGSEILGIIANDSISSFGKNKTLEIDTTEKSPEKVVEKIHELIMNPKEREVVDWLTLVEEKNEFDRFFDY
tara:strand:+ start:520 stop:1074 length:555 start_codon:yes stop_codon:yes gene_type:complete